MALEALFNELAARATRAAQAWNNLSWAAVEAQPQGGPGHTLVDFYDAGAADLLGLAGEAAEAAGQARKAAREKTGLKGAGDALAACHERVVSMRRRYSQELMSLESIASLTSLAEERQGAWAVWVEGVRDALVQASATMIELESALPPCWRELSERTGSRGLSVQNTAAGAQFFMNKK
jgi:hypothetical protein